MRIRLLNEYYRLKYSGVSFDKLPVYIDFDGVVLDTFFAAGNLIMAEHGIDLPNHDRSNVENDRIISNFFKGVDWYKLINETPEINHSKEFIKLINSSIIYDPCIYSIVNSQDELLAKMVEIEGICPVRCKFAFTGEIKTCDDDKSVLVDDDDYNLINWVGKPIHFSSARRSIFPTINDLGELYFLFLLDKDLKFKELDGLYSGYTQEYNDENRLVWRLK